MKNKKRGRTGNKTGISRLCGLFFLTGLSLVTGPADAVTKAEVIAQADLFGTSAFNILNISLTGGKATIPYNNAIGHNLIAISSTRPIAIGYMCSPNPAAPSGKGREGLAMIVAYQVQYTEDSGSQGFGSIILTPVYAQMGVWDSNSNNAFINAYSYPIARSENYSPENIGALGNYVVLAAGEYTGAAGGPVCSTGLSAMSLSGIGTQIYRAPAFPDNDRLPGVHDGKVSVNIGTRFTMLGGYWDSAGGADG